MQNVWFERRHLNGEPHIRLFCFPFAGGNCSTYSDWPKALGGSVEVVCIQLAGRGIRFNETPYTRMQPLIDALVPSFLEMDTTPFAFFGHSMGALIAYEVACRLDGMGVSQPAMFFASGAEPPHLVQQGEGLYKQSDADLEVRLRTLNGMPEEVLENKELLELLLPVIRADFELTETYRFRGGHKPQFPIVAFCGSNDPEVSPELMNRWSEMTHGSFRLSIISGDHFFVKSKRAELLMEVRKYLRACIGV